MTEYNSMYMYLNRFTFRKTSFVNQEVLYKARLLSSFTQSSVPNFVSSTHYHLTHWRALYTIKLALVSLVVQIMIQSIIKIKPTVMESKLKLTQTTLCTFFLEFFICLEYQIKVLYDLLYKTAKLFDHPPYINC